MRSANSACLLQSKLDAQQSRLYVTNRKRGAEISGLKVQVLARTTGGETTEVSRLSWLAQPAPCPLCAVGMRFAPSITVNDQIPLPRPAAKSRGPTTVDRSPQAGTIQ